MNESKRNDFIAQSLIDLDGNPNAHGRVFSLYRAMRGCVGWGSNSPDGVSSGAYQPCQWNWAPKKRFFQPETES